MNKNTLIKNLLSTTIRFKADGKQVVISQFDTPIVTVDGVDVNKDILYTFHTFDIPKSWDTPYGVMSYDFGGKYHF